MWPISSSMGQRAVISEELLNLRLHVKALRTLLYFQHYYLRKRIRLWRARCELATLRAA